jgi:hypothetical protein
VKTFFPAKSTCAALLLFICGCAVNFTNAQQGISPEYRKVFVPAATDISTSGGNSLRISQAVRRKLAKNTQFELVPLEEARWGIDIRIVARKIGITLVEVCTTANPIIASGAHKCDDTNIHIPTKVADQEGVGMVAEIHTIDLRTGQTIRKSQVDLNPSEVPFWVVADRNGDGARVRSSLSRTPELHALRYAENLDAAVERAGERIATQVMAMMEALSSGN